MTLPSSSEQYMLDLINAERAKVGAKPLVFDDNLQVSSENHSQWMIASDNFSHQGANGSTPTQRMESAGYDFTGGWASGENIAWSSRRLPDGDLDEVRLMHENLMNSPGHRENILNPAFEEIGIGVEIGNMQGWDAAVVTQNFGVSSAASTPPGAIAGDSNPNIDDAFYLSRNPDVAAAGMDPDEHYALWGWREGRDPSAGFSTSGYLAANPDVAAAGMNPLDHWISYGMSEGRSLGLDLLL
jgi:Cysteine-rich secretory protein family